MAGKISSNQVNENVLKQCHEIYIKPETGLVTLAENWGRVILEKNKTYFQWIYWKTIHKYIKT